MSDEPQAAFGAPLAAVAASLAVGARVAGYRLEQQVGMGGMATVFRAVDERLERPVALKVLAPALAADEAFRRRFIRESRAAAAVDHPNIIPVYEAGEASGMLFIAMRYVPGGDVRTLARSEGPMAPPRACAVVSPVASALDAAHAAGLIHRDVKPANMLVDVRPDRPDHVYLSDFGLSKGELSSSGLTGTGHFLGTVDYCAPEQIEGGAVDGRADQYALACSAFELLTGAPPFQRDKATAMIWAHMSQDPPPLTTRRPDLPLAADQVFARALAKSPAYRYPTCREFADALRQALGLAPYYSTAGPPVPGHPPTEIASTAVRGGTPGPVPSRAATAGTRRPTLGTPGMATSPETILPTPAAGYGPPHPGGNRRPKRPWKRDWTAWVLILAFPVALTGILLSPLHPVGTGIGGTMFFLALLGVPVALIAKLARWFRHRGRPAQRR